MAYVGLGLHVTLASIPNHLYYILTWRFEIYTATLGGDILKGLPSRAVNPLPVATELTRTRARARTHAFTLHASTTCIHTARRLAYILADKALRFLPLQWLAI